MLQNPAGCSLRALIPVLYMRVQVALPSARSAAAGETDAAGIDLGFAVRWEDDGRIGVTHSGAFLAMQAS